KTGAILSIGGNDALGRAQVLIQEVRMVMEALSFLIPIVEEFRRNYVAVLEELMRIYEKKHIRICTIYNKIPTAPKSELPEETMLALGLFNDVITEEVNRRGLRLIDLRVICDSTDCYSEVSPI
ncbi:MAG: SGNH/GDSL hydrolase family protein, partial [Deltaproteobacteria bacterium]